MTQLIGVAEVLARLETMDRKVKRDVLRKPVAAVTRSIAADVKRRIPKRTGRLRKAIGTKVTFRDGVAAGEIGARKGKGGPHLHLVEFGTVGRIQKTTGRRTGYMPARPVIRPAIAAHRHLLPVAIRNAFIAATGATK